jgi:hypothetical protein
MGQISNGSPFILDLILFPCSALMERDWSLYQIEMQNIPASSISFLLIGFPKEINRRGEGEMGRWKAGNGNRGTMKYWRIRSCHAEMQ